VLLDEHERSMEGIEVLAQAGLDAIERIDTIARAHQAAREAVQTLGDGVIGARHAHEVCEFAFDGGVFLAQHLDLPLDQ
jgi:hypothetical protein